MTQEVHQSFLGREPGSPLPIGFNDLSCLWGRLSVDQAVALHRGVGSSLVRFHLEWGSVQREEGAEFDFSEFDAYLDALRVAGMRPIIELAGSPAWALSADQRDAYARTPRPGPPARERDSEWAAYAAAVAARYPWIAALEIWNEPNHSGFWLGPVDPGRYTELLVAAYPAIKSVAPDLPVLGGSLAPWGLEEFIRGMYAGGAAAAMDAFSFHPYPVHALSDSRQLFEPTVQQVRRLLDEHDDAHRRLWVTETGVSTIEGIGSVGFTGEEQAQTCLGMYQRLADIPEVDVCLFHTLLEIVSVDNPAEEGFGWIRQIGTGFEVKPVYAAFGGQLDPELAADPDSPTDS